MPLKTREQQLEYQRQWRLKNKEQIRKYSAQYYKENESRFIEWNRLWRERNVEKRRASAKAWNANNRERKADLQRAWRKNNKDSVRARYQRNRLREVLRAYNVRDGDRAMFMERHGLGCQYCGDVGFLEVDHKHPRSKGGGDHVSNLQWLCRKCNRSKSNLTEQEFFDHIKKLVAIRQQFEDCEALACK